MEQSDNELEADETKSLMDLDMGSAISSDYDSDSNASDATDLD
jgi:hypothetical protein